jgi:hypothetical protein
VTLEKMNARFPRVFRAYLRELGRERFDAPVYQYAEGEAAPKKVSEGFAGLLDSELKLMEENNRLQRESGGYFVSLAGGFRRTIYPARDEGPSPLETEDRFTD